jgi:hypothetical protein
MIVADLFAAAVVAPLLVAPVLFLLVPRSAAGGRASYPETVGVALAGLLGGGIANALLGWLPVVGVFAAPLAWVGVLRVARRADLPTTVGVGFLAWAVSTVAYALVGVVA